MESLGEWSFVLRDLKLSPAQVAHSVHQLRLEGLVDVVPCIDSVGVYFQPGTALRDLDRFYIADTPRPHGHDFRAKLHEIPVCYDLGIDWAIVAGRLQLTPAEIIALHTSKPFPCFSVGFCPGFAYLGPLPELLRGIPRLPSPRTAVEPGMVGLTGNQTAAYPLLRPGGWPLIGRTPLTLVDVADDYFPTRVGDLVRFRAIELDEFEALHGRRL